MPQIRGHTSEASFHSQHCPRVLPNISEFSFSFGKLKLKNQGRLLTITKGLTLLCTFFVNWST